MAIIYTYPTKATLATSDLILISDSADANKTKNATVTSIKDAIDVVDSLTAGSGISLSASTGAITIANTGVLSISSANTALTTSGSSAVTLTSTPYGGGSTIGHVPAGGTAGNSLDGAGTWSTIDLTTDVNGILPAENGGLGGGVFNNGDLVYYTGSAFTRLATNGVTDNYVLTAASGVPTWALNPGGGSGPGTGTQYNLPIWSTTSTLGDSLITQNAGATVLNVGTNIASFSTVAGVGSVFTTRVSVNGYSTFGGKLKLSSPDGATSVEIEGPANGGAAYTVKMPSSLGTANQVLKLPSTIPGSGASQLVWDDAANFLQPSNTTTPSIKISGANTTDANSGGLGQAFSDAQGVVNLQGLSSTLNSTVMAVSGEDNVANSVGNLMNFFMASHLGPGYTLVGRIEGNRNTGSISFSNASDYRLKKNITSITGSLDKVKALNPVNYNITDIYENPNPVLIEGFLAHELQAQIPNAVTGEKDAVNEDGSIKAQTVDLVRVIPYLVGAIKELTAKVEALEN